MIFFRILLCTIALTISFSCNKEDIDSNDNDALTNQIYYQYLEYDEALKIVNELSSNSFSYFSENASSKNQNIDLLRTNFWNKNEQILINTSKNLNYSKNLNARNLQQLDIILSDQIINDSQYLTDKQKEYAVDLFRATKSNKISKLVSIKERFTKDVLVYPELKMFNLGIAFIENAETISLTGKDCSRAAMIGGTMSGIAGMIGGAITGGLAGFTVGGVLTGGTLAIPAGGAGAVGGAVAGGLSGYASGAALGWLGCKIFG